MIKFFKSIFKQKEPKIEYSGSLDIKYAKEYNENKVLITAREAQEMFRDTDEYLHRNLAKIHALIKRKSQYGHDCVTYYPYEWNERVMEFVISQLKIADFEVEEGTWANGKKYIFIKWEQTI